MREARSLFLMLLAVVLLVSGCAAKDANVKKQATAAPEKIVVQAPLAPPTAPLYKILKDGQVNGVKVELIIYKSVEEATTRVVKGEADLTVLPVNVAAKLYNKQADISLANVSTWGILSLVTTDKQVQNWQDLKGKELYVGAQGSTPDVLTQYFIHKNNIQASDIKLAYLGSPEIAQLMINGIAKYAVLPEPQTTQVLMKNSQAVVARDFFTDWQAFEGSAARLPQAGMVVRNEFARTYPKALSDFQNVYKNAMEWTMANPAEAAPLVESNMSIPAAVFTRSMERTRLTYATGAQAKADVNTYLARLLDISPEMVGGKLPDEKFFLTD